MLLVLKSLLREFEKPNVSEEGPARQEYLTRAIYSLVTVGIVVMTVVVLSVSYGVSQPSKDAMFIVSTVDLLVLSGWALIVYGRWRLSGILLPAVFLLSSGYMIFTVGPLTTAVLHLAIAVLLAGMLLGNQARWTMLLVCMLVYLLAGWGSGERDLALILSSGISLLLSLSGIALLDWFFSNLLNTTLSNVREREAKLQSIFRAAPVGIGMVVDRVIREANPTLCQMTGYAREELIGNSSRMLYLTQEDYENVGLENYRQIGLGGRGSVETRWRCKEGAIRDILLSSVPLDRNDLSMGITFSALDITERKQAAQALYESEERYRQAVENSPNPIFSIDRQGHIQTWNRACEKAFLYEQSIIGQHYYELLRNTEDRARVKGMLDKLSCGQSITNLDMAYRSQDGEECFMVSRIYPICNQQKAVHGYVFANTDVTERKNAEITLQESAARYRAVVENQTEFIVRWKPDGMRTFANEAYLRYFDLTLEEALSSSFMPLVVEEDRSAMEEKFSRMLSGESYVETDVHRIIKPDGSIGWQEWTDHAIYNEHGQLVEFQSIGRDITERKLADEALHTKTEELEALFSISAHLRAAQSADGMLPLVLDEMRRVLRSDANAVILLDPDHMYFTYALSDGSLEVNNGMQFSAEKSVSGLVMQTRQPYITDDVSSDPNKTSALRGDDGLGPAIVVPVVSESEFLGVLFCARNKDGTSLRYSSSEVRLLTAIGEMVGNALRRARLYDQALKRMQHLQTLHSIDTAISANLDLTVILEVLLTQGIPQLDADAACVLLLNSHTHTLEYAAGKGFRTKEINSARLRLGDGLPGKAALGRKVLYIANLSQAQNLSRKFLLEEGFVSYQAAPLIAKGQLQGVLEIFNRRPMNRDEEQTGFLETLAIQAAIAIDNSQLFSELQHSNFELELAYDATIEGWSRALELRDQETEGHTLRVTDMTVRLAQEIGVRREELIHVRRGALLHDIGKMGVPDRILLKPGKLEDDEWEIMKQHTVYAFEMLLPIEFLRPAIDIPYCHHERWDGTGYPRQLKAEQIPLSARLFAIADVWDALTSDRPYRKAWTEEKAFDYILTNKGKHFDPQVVDLFSRLRSRKGEEWGFA